MRNLAVLARIRRGSRRGGGGTRVKPANARGGDSSRRSSEIPVNALDESAGGAAEVQAAQHRCHAASAGAGSPGLPSPAPWQIATSMESSANIAPARAVARPARKACSITSHIAMRTIAVRRRRAANTAGTGVPIPKFASPCGTPLMRTSESKGHWQLYESSAAFEPEVRKHACRPIVRTSGSRH